MLGSPSPLQQSAVTLPKPEFLFESIRRHGLGLGFARVGCYAADEFETARERLHSWLAAGRHGQMEYLSSGDDRADPRALLPQARSLIVVALPCPADDSTASTPAAPGYVARYARGVDYHIVVRDKLRALLHFVEQQVPRPVAARICVDTAPILEREAARRAGIAFIGKNTLAIAPGVGSHVMLGVLLLDVELATGTPLPDGCGSCRACLDACPTSAFTAPQQLDARRCISYLTIELQGVIPADLRAGMGANVFGCDHCQDACPYNKGAATAVQPDAAFAARTVPAHPDLLGWLHLSSTGYRRLVKRTALRRVNRQRLQRNAAVALGNTGDVSVVRDLAAKLACSDSALVRAHCAWALGRIGGEVAVAALHSALDDADPDVVGEVRAALAECARTSQP